MQLNPVRDQTVVVMGASGGLGRETALRSARKGARVVAAARGGEGLNSLVEEIRGEGGAAAAIRADVTDFDQVKAVADGTVEQYVGLDTWVHLVVVVGRVPGSRA